MAGVSEANECMREPVRRAESLRGMNGMSIDLCRWIKQWVGCFRESIALFLVFMCVCTMDAFARSSTSYVTRPVCSTLDSRDLIAYTVWNLPKIYLTESFPLLIFNSSYLFASSTLLRFLNIVLFYPNDISISPESPSIKQFLFSPFSFLLPLNAQPTQSYSIILKIASPLTPASSPLSAKIVVRR